VVSALGSFLARLAGGSGGPAVTTAVIVGGLVVGGLAGGFATAGAQPGPTTAVPGELPIYPCPGSGSPLAKAPGGQRMLATGRTADGTWIRIYFPSPGRSEGWVPAGALELASAPESLPLAECARVLAGPAAPTAGATFTVTAANSPSPSPTPEATPTPTPSPTASPTPRPTKTPAPTVKPTKPPATPTPTPTPTAPPRDTTPPVVAKAAPSVSTISVTGSLKCRPTSLSISVVAYDRESGLASVQAIITNVATGQRLARDMKPVVGAGPDVYVTSFDAQGDKLGTGTWNVEVRAVNKVKLSASDFTRFSVVDC
jgi:hypothetical protein